MSVVSRVRTEVRDIKGYVSGEQPASGSFIKLNTNENPFPPSDQAIAAIQGAAAQQLNVYPDAQATSFREAAAERWGLDPDWIICGNGSDDILTILTRTFVPAGSKIRIPYPSYVLYRTLADLQGATTEEIHFENDWSLTNTFAADDPNLSLIFLPNPNSPSGTIIEPDKIRELATGVSCPFVVDEAYADFSKSNCVSLVKEIDNVIVTRTLSKSYGLAGLRFGYAIARPEVIAEMQKVKDSYNCDALATAGATAALKDQTWLDSNVRIMNSLRDVLTAELKQLGFLIVPSQANFLWCKHPERSSEAIYQHLKAHQILVRYMDYPNWGDGIRISVGTSSQISTLVAILESYFADSK